MDVLPQLPPYQGNRIRKGRVSFVIPRRAAHASHSLFDQQLGRQCDDRVEAQQRWGGASNGALTPLALRFHPQMRPRFLKRYFLKVARNFADYP